MVVETETFVASLDSTPCVCWKSVAERRSAAAVCSVLSCVWNCLSSVCFWVISDCFVSSNVRGCRSIAIS